MDKFQKYILKEFSPTFFTIFSIILIIISLIYIITISNITSKIEITFIELIKFYLLSLPQILLITISISFFIAANSIYSKLSETHEIVAIFSLGFKPFKVLKPILILGILFSIINLVLLFISIPYAKMSFKNLKNEKKQEAKFNFKSSQISQQFGDWSIFANKKNKNFSDIYLFSNKEKKFIIASSANLNSKKGILSFNMKNGKIYDLNQTYIIEFQSMQINQRIPKIKISIFNFKNYFNYNKKLFAKYLPIALLPTVLIFFIPIISFFHPRLHKNHTLLYSFIILSLYTVLSLSNKNFVFSLIISIITLMIGGILYKWKLKF